MKNISLKIFALLFLCFSCNKTDDTISPDIEKETVPAYLRTIDFSSSVSNTAEIQDFDIENGYLYFIYDIGIYSINLGLTTDTLKLIIEDDIDWPQTLKVINNTLYYQADPAFAYSQNIKQVDLNSISAGVKSTHSIIGTSRSQFCKNSNKLYYLSSNNGLSPINNFYEFDPSSNDQLVATDEFIHPQNMRVVNHYLYFSSKKEIRRIDLNNPTEGSSIVYTVSDTANNPGSSGDILGFDIKDNVIYFTQVSNNKLLAKDLGQPNEELVVLKINGNEGVTGYGKLIIADGKLYVKKIIDKQLEVFEF